jgi:cardiolipin synthase
MALTLANQLTLIRLALVPAFVILGLYGRMGWALAAFVTAGITDGLDGLIAMDEQRTALGVPGPDGDCCCS